MNMRLLKMMLVFGLLAFSTGWTAAQDASPPSTSRPKEEPRRFGYRLTEKDEAQILDFIKKNMPELHGRLVRMRKTDTSRYRRMLSHMQYQVRMLQALPEEVRKAQLKEMQLRLEIFKTAKAWNAAVGEEKKKLGAKLTALTREAFDAEQTLREHRLKDIEKRLEQLRKELETRKADREAVIAKQVERIKDDVKSGKFDPPERDRGSRRRPRSSRDKSGPPRKSGDSGEKRSAPPREADDSGEKQPGPPPSSEAAESE